MTGRIPLSGNRRVKGHHAAFMDRGHSRSFFLIEELTEELRRSEKADLTIEDSGPGFEFSLDSPPGGPARFTISFPA